MVKEIKNQIERIDNEKKIFWILLSLSVFFIVLYGFLINQTIVNAVLKDNMKKQMSMLNDKVNSLDYEYLDLEKGITKDLALSKGFVEMKDLNVALVDSNKDSGLSLNKN